MASSEPAWIGPGLSLTTYYHITKTEGFWESHTYAGGGPAETIFRREMFRRIRRIDLSYSDWVTRVAWDVEEPVRGRCWSPPAL